MISTGVHVLQKLEEIRDIVASNRINADRSRETNNVRKLHDEEEMHMYQEPVKQPPYHITEVKKRRGVSLATKFGQAHFSVLTLASARLLLDGVTAATGLTLLNGDADLTAPARSATLVAFTTRSWSVDGS